MRAFLCVLLSLAVLGSSAFANRCNEHTTCAECEAQTTCVWCENVWLATPPGPKSGCHAIFSVYGCFAFNTECPAISPSPSPSPSTSPSPSSSGTVSPSVSLSPSSSISLTSSPSVSVSHSLSPSPSITPHPVCQAHYFTKCSLAHPGCSREGFVRSDEYTMLATEDSNGHEQVVCWPWLAHFKCCLPYAEVPEDLTQVPTTTSSFLQSTTSVASIVGIASGVMAVVFVLLGVIGWRGSARRRGQGQGQGFQLFPIRTPLARLDQAAANHHPDP